MKKRILLIALSLLLIVMVGCGKESANKEEKIEEIEVVGEMENKTTSVKREDLGEYTSISKMGTENISAEDELIKITITDYALNELKPNDEYKDYFSDIGVDNIDEIAIVDIEFLFENLSDDILELTSLQGSLKTNTGEEVPVIFDFFDGQDEDKAMFSGKEAKDGSVSAILNSNAKEIESFKLIYDDSIVLEFNLK